MNQVELLNNTCYLGRQLEQLAQKMNQMAALNNAVQQEESYQYIPPLSWNISKLSDRSFSLWCKVFGIWILFLLFLGGIISFIYGFLILAYIIARKRTNSKLLRIAAVLGAFVVLSCVIPLLIERYNVDWNFLHIPYLKWALLVVAYFIVARSARKLATEANYAAESENNRISLRNAQRQTHNEALVNQCHALTQEVRVLQGEIAKTVQTIHFPPDYVCLNAVRFFIHGLRNDRADDYRHLIDLYEENNFRQQMLNGQQELINLARQAVYNQQRMIQLMEYANALSAANLAAQMQTQVETRAAAAQVSHAVYNASTY